MGNEAVARGAIEAGVQGVFSYPGTPSTEIAEIFRLVNGFQHREENCSRYPGQTRHPVYFEYSVNEKIALEKGIAYSVGNKRSLCTMKNVGLNVASDALMTITYQTFEGALVIVVCDDPGCHSSSNEQDSRYWGKMASVPLFNPATPAEAHQAAKNAFALSHQLKLPVIVRLTTRVSHSRGILHYGQLDASSPEGGFNRDPEHINVPKKTTSAHDKLLEKLKDPRITRLCEKFSTVEFSGKDSEQWAVISSGVAGKYVSEILMRHFLDSRVSHLRLGIVHPFPVKEVTRFLSGGFGKILVVEELEPIVENEVRLLVQKENITVEITGKAMNGFSRTGEYSLDIVREGIENWLGIPLEGQPLLEGGEKLQGSLPPRPPRLCSGCPHRATFYGLKLMFPQREPEVVLCGDIGCFGLGALPPLQMIDTIHHMGMSISMAQGLNEALAGNKNNKLVALVGDGTFFHSGIPSLMNALYTQSNITVIIFDNRTIGMTGHQDHPGAPQTSKYLPVDLPSLVRGMGVKVVEEIDPFSVRESFKKIRKAFDHNGLSVLISKSQCIFLPGYKEAIPKDKTVKVNPLLCNTCHNHDDESLLCSVLASPERNLVRARAKIEAGSHIPGNEQLCPANICNPGFFNAILEGNYNEALEVVRDKILFAHVCGDVCPRPCEALYKKPSRSVVPVKKLKQFVASFSGNFNNWNSQEARWRKNKRNGKKVAVVGSGPAGLSAAYDLAREGYALVVYEKENSTGGLLKFGIPDFRMNKSGCEQEIGFLKKLGVEFCFNTALGKDIMVEGLSEKYDAVVIATGMPVSLKLDRVEKALSGGQKFTALSFLKKYNLKKLQTQPASSFFVIGGGNSAMDAARAAKKFHPGNEVILSCLESYDQIPALPEERDHAVEEGIRIIDDSYVGEIKKNGGNKIDITLNRFSNGKSIEDLSCDYVITAIGQKADAGIRGNFEISADENDRIHPQDKNGKLDAGNIFVAGDLDARNHVSIIGAIGSGKRAATGVRRLLEEYSFGYEGERALNFLNESGADWKDPEKFPGGLLKSAYIQQKMPSYYLSGWCEKCNHCIDNFGCPALVKVDGKVVVDQESCTRCGLCIDVCPNEAIEWVKTEEAVEAR